MKEIIQGIRETLKLLEKDEVPEVRQLLLARISSSLDSLEATLNNSGKIEVDIPSAGNIDANQGLVN